MMNESKTYLNNNSREMILISSCWLLLVLVSSLVGCHNSAEPTDELNVDRDIPPSEDFDASYGFWGPDGETIYFKHSEELGSDPDPGKLDQLWKLNLETGKREMIHTGRILNADISPDGQWIVFHSFSLPQYLYKMRSNGSDLQKITGPDSPHPEWEYTIMGKWSPDGSQILFAKSAGEPRGISLMDSTGSDPEIIIPYGVSPSWAPDGKDIYYINWDTTRIQQNQRQIYKASRDGSNPQKLSDLKNTSKLSYPSLSPVSTKIVFAFHDEIFLMSTNGDNIQQLTDGSGYIKRPEWSPDGQTILFSRIIQNVSKRLYYLDVESREVTPVFPAENNK
jgi:Tol biopolymer transport system component